MAERFSSLLEIGRFQWCCLLLYGLVCGTNIGTGVAILFIAPTLNFHCDDAEPSYQNLTADQQRAIMMTFGSCQRPDVDFSLYTSEELINLNVSHGITSRKCDTGYVYDHTYFDYTVTEQYNLVCDRKWMISMTKTTYMLGYLFGAFLNGPLSDRFGRKATLVATAVLTSLMNFVSALSPSAIVFMVARCLVGATCIAFYTAGLILATELVRKDQRKYPRVVLSISIDVLKGWFVVVSIFLRDHRYLQYYLGVMMAIFALATWLFLPESVRWLSSQNRHKEADEIIDRIARFNKCPPETLSYLHVVESTDGQETKANMLDLFKTPVLRKRIFLLILIWLCHVLSSYALFFNLGSFYPDLRISLLISGAIEICAVMLPVFGVDICGRQIISFTFFAVAGVCCLGLIPFQLMSMKGSVGMLILALMAKMMLGNQFFCSYLWTQELFPTVVRSQALGLASSMSRIGGMIAPQIALLDDIWPSTSVVIIGCAVILAATLVPFLPDTTNWELPQSLRDGEQFLANHRYKLMLPRKETEKRSDEVNINGETGVELKQKLKEIEQKTA